MKKKVLSLVLACLMVLTLAACGGDTSTAPADPSAGGAAPASTAGGEPAAAADGDVLKIGVVWRRFDDDFQSGFRKIMEAEAQKAGGFELNMQDGEDDVAKGNNKLDTLLASGYEYIAICAKDRTAPEYMMQKCKEDNVPVVFFNLEPYEETMQSYERAWYVGARPEESGAMSAQVLCDYWLADTEKADKNGDGVLQLIILQGEIGHNDVELRTQAYKDTLDANGIPYEIVKQDAAVWEKSLAQDKMTAYITELGAEGIEGVLANNDAMALGAVNACLQNGFNQPGSDDFIPICGIDATVEALESMKAGALLGTCLNDRAGQSNAILNILRSVSEGNENITDDVVNVEGTTIDGRYIWVPYQKVNYDNVDEVLADML